MRRALPALLLALGAGRTAGAPSPAKQACQPFDASEVRKVLRIPVGQPHGAAGASMLSCTAEGGGVQVTLSHTAEPDPVLGSAGEFNKTVEAARASGRVEVREFKETRCATLLPSGGGKFARYKCLCALHSKGGRYVSLEVLAPSERLLPKLEQLRTAAEAAAGRVR
ncbi:MAG TPA: hypothetical protein VEJ89_09495 [Myxococcaceae bacterium]|jgi:hypothetical protein|nr:hypothetical protein [Myxococcaceae bacterium]